MADITVFRLIRNQISQPFCIEFFSIIIKAGSTDKDLGIAGPAQTFVTLRAVGWYVYKISFLSPDDVGEKFVQAVVGSGEVTGAFHIRMNCNCSKSIRCYFVDPTGKCIYPNVAEAPEG